MEFQQTETNSISEPTYKRLHWTLETQICVVIWYMFNFHGIGFIISDKISNKKIKYCWDGKQPEKKDYFARTDWYAPADITYWLFG